MSKPKKQQKPKSAETKSPPAETAKTERVRRPKVFAGECPKNAGHRNTRVYKTDGRTRRCKCNDCGATWKITGEYADELREYAATIAQSLDDCPRVEDPNGERVIVMDDRTAREMAAELRRLLKD